MNTLYISICIDYIRTITHMKVEEIKTLYIENKFPEKWLCEQDDMTDISQTIY